MTMRPPLKTFIVGFLMVLSALLGWQLQPSELITENVQPSIDLETTVPESFGDWKVDRTIIPLPPSPEVAQELRETYAQLLERTYINSQGERVMLSIAYGDRQKDGLRVHFPEICYESQGFRIHELQKGILILDGKEIPVVRMSTQKGIRYEPVTYWVTIGGATATTSAFEQKLASLTYGITGQIPDGMLMRVSTIDTNTEGSYETQQRFLEDMLHALDPSVRRRFFGEGF